MVFDITNSKSFEMINFWIKEVNEKTDFSKIDLLLVGNKIDLQEERQVTSEAANKIASEIGIVYVETSAKTFESTKGAFDQLVAKIIKRKKKIDCTKEGFKLEDTKNKKKTNDTCC